MSKPNLLFLMPDQLRPDFLSCYGADFIQTPHIDRIAREGMRYNRAYSVSPICVPARASLLTGLNAIRTGVTDNGQWLRPDRRACDLYTWAERLADHGYRTAAVGKMHFYPWDLSMGFHYRVAAEDKRWIHVRDDYYRFLRQHGERKYHGNEHEGYYENKGAIVNRLPLELSVDHFVGVEAERFIRTYGGETPWAMMVGFPGPHCPYDPTPEYNTFDPAQMPPAIPDSGHSPLIRQQNIEGNKGAWNGVDHTEFTAAHMVKVRAHYAGLVKAIDDEVGRILQALEESGQLEKTVIIFASDHGDYLGDHGLIGKGTFYESSMHVPLLVRLPQGPAGQETDHLVELTDVTATLMALAGVPIPDFFDSRPLPELGLDTNPRQRLFGMVSGGWMACDGRYRLAKYSTGEHLLFDLQADPTEQVNRLHDPALAAVRQRLDDDLTQEIMRSLSLANQEKRVYSGNSLWSDPNFGHRGWQRVYPVGMGD